MNKMKKPFESFMALLIIILIVIGMFGMGYVLVLAGKSGYETDQEFRMHGIHVPATLTGYRYHISKYHSGDIPVFMYITPDGVNRTYVAYDYGVAADYKKKILQTQKVEITYLPSSPEKARVDKWTSAYPSQPESFFGYILLILSIAGVCDLIRIILSFIRNRPDQ